jgi:hypothetical protein
MWVPSYGGVLTTDMQTSRCPDRARQRDCLWSPERTAPVLQWVQGRVSLETVTSEGCHRHTDFFRLPGAMPCDDRGRACLNFLAIFLLSDTEMLKLSWHGSTLPVSFAYLLTGSEGSALYVFRDRAPSCTARIAVCVAVSDHTRAKAGIIASPGG